MGRALVGGCDRRKDLRAGWYNSVRCSNSGGFLRDPSLIWGTERNQDIWAWQ